MKNMKETGIIRRIDDLGRVVIPREIRSKVKIKEGDLLEIHYDDNGVYFQKHNLIKDFVGVGAKQFIDSLSKITGYMAIITDLYNIVSVSEITPISFLGGNISSDIQYLFNAEFNNVIYRKSIRLIEESNVSVLISRIIAKNQVEGAVILFAPEMTIGETEAKLIEMTSLCIGKLLESLENY